MFTVIEKQDSLVIYFFYSLKICISGMMYKKEWSFV